jgi:UDP-N-acetyl-D-mannosaminuronic acid dehydrogenase
MKTVCVIGLGYIGLPTASLLAARGYSVRGTDISQTVVDTINRGEIHIIEPELDVLVRSAVRSGNLRAALTPAESDVFLIAVPTPALADHQPDLSYVEAASKGIVPYVRPGNLVILESTSPVGTTEGVVVQALRAGGLKVGAEVFVAYCPERVLPGRILTELIENDRVVGGINAASTRAAVSFYETFVRGKILPTNSRTAEMVKLTENSFRDVNIAFANELSLICDKEGIDVWELISLANRHPRVKILQPGPGVGGHCIAVDPWFIVASAPEQARLIRVAREVNDHKPDWVVDRVAAAAQRRGKNVRIACLGLAYKADIADMRESPAVEIVQKLVKRGIGDVLVCEPYLPRHPEFNLVTLEEAVRQADILVVLVDHSPFRALKQMDLSSKVVIDTRGMLVPSSDSAAVE